jgi:hypothetical protein
MMGPCNLLFVGSFLAAAGLLIVFKVKGRKTMIDGPMVSVPAGRFLIDVPEQAELDWGRQAYRGAGPFIDTFTAPTPEIVKELVDAQVKELDVPHPDGGSQLGEVTAGRFPGSWFVHFWKSSSNKYSSTGYSEVDGYFWKNGRGFKFSQGARSDLKNVLEVEKDLERQYQKVRLRAPREIPEEAGFCFDQAYFRGEPEPDHCENIALHVSFPSHPDIFVRFSTDVVPYISHLTLLKRTKRDVAARAVLAVMGIRTIRSRERKAGPYRGQELVKRLRQGIGKVGYSFTWEFQGEVDNCTVPALQLEMMTGWNEDSTGNSSLSRKQAMALWDAMLDSIRLREPHPQAL